ncbi:MAG TPA: hypothetical protein VL068_03375 [Microthrixaceae bacterium]|nr:hypothetical protein [Microthrixaceae bacterium]
MLNAGAERVSNPTKWLAKHRKLTTDPTEKKKVIRGVRRRSWLTGLGWVTGIAAFALFLLSGESASESTVVLNIGLAVLAAVLFLGASVTKRRLNRPRNPQSLG